MPDVKMSDMPSLDTPSSKTMLLAIDPGTDSTANYKIGSGGVASWLGVGIPAVDVKGRYGAFMDGTSHVLSSVYGSLQEAQSAYPDAGISSEDMASMEIDTAALLQAESDGRNGSGALLGLPDNCGVMVSKQLYFQNAGKVWLRGGRNSRLYTEATGTTPAIRVSHSDGGANGSSIPLAHIYLCAKNSGPVSVSTNLSGVPHAGFATGAVAFAIDNCQGSVFDQVTWSGYDKPFSWGDNTFGIILRDCVASGCNYGLNWDQVAGLNSMERMLIDRGSYSNNNEGIHWDATFGSSQQGGSVFIRGCSIDYNIVRHINYIGMPSGETTSGNSLHVAECHIETTGACSGNSVGRIFANGKFTINQCELYEGDGTVPIGYVQIGDDGANSMTNCSINNGAMACFYSTTSAKKRVGGVGNYLQNMGARPILLSDLNGYLMQPDPFDNTLAEVNGSFTPNLAHQNREVYIDTSLANTFTFPSDSNAPFYIGTLIRFILGNTGTTTFAAEDGVTLNAWGLTLTGVGRTALAFKHAPNFWILRGRDLV